MMKSAVGIIVLLLCASFSKAQNLIPNPGFESYKDVPCGSMLGSLSAYVADWQNPAGGTPDFICSEATTNCYASPRSSHWDSYGSEDPHSGKGMVMIMTSGHNGTYREYLAINLAKPLVKGQRYYAEFYVSLGDYCGVATNNIGMLFRTGTFKNVSDYIITGNPQINSTTVIDQTEGWYKVSGTFTADAGYTHVLIGNFLTKEQTAVKVLPAAHTYVQPHTYRESMSAYFVDDFLLRNAETKLGVSGDTLVNVGTVANLLAVGGLTYAWADAERPGIIIGSGEELKVTMNKKRTFFVYSNGDTAQITVDIRKAPSLYMSELEGRKVRKGKAIDVKSAEVTIQVYDNNEIDGDSISLYYGDSLIVKNLALTEKKVSYTIRVDQSKPKQIILFAENQGFIPPNTARIIVKDGRISTEIYLQSDYRFSDSVLLTYKDE